MLFLTLKPFRLGLLDVVRVAGDERGRPEVVDLDLGSVLAACILCQAIGEIVQARTKERAMRTLRSAPAMMSK